MTVPISGTVQGQPGVGLGAGWNGTGQIASLDDPAGPPVPQALLNLLAHPDGVSVFGFATGGIENLAESAVTIDSSISPAAIPEPSALAIILAGAAVYAIRRLRPRATKTKVPGTVLDVSGQALTCSTSEFADNCKVCFTR